jgi:hypothetical protein
MTATTKQKRKTVAVRTCSDQARWGSIHHLLMTLAAGAQRAHDTLLDVAELGTKHAEATRSAAVEIRKAQHALIGAIRILNVATGEPSESPPPHQAIDYPTTRANGASSDVCMCKKGRGE